MTPAMQQWVVIAVVVAAATYISRHAWRSWRAAVAARQTPGCGPDCGCG